MGMSYTGFGAPVTVKNLKVNADLDLGNYDLTATDVKGDTAEFDEFVGGVGNFTNVLGSGNLDIEGTGNVKGLTTFQNGVQVNGSLHVEGSINNVNIADNGEITTAQGVNGADFNGAKITSSKFNGATIDTSGNVTGAKGSFSGAVTGSTINGASITSTKFNGVTINTSGDVAPNTLTLKVKDSGLLHVINETYIIEGMIYTTSKDESFTVGNSISTGSIKLSGNPRCIISMKSNIGTGYSRAITIRINNNIVYDGSQSYGTTPTVLYSGLVPLNSVVRIISPANTGQGAGTCTITYNGYI